MEDLNKYCAPGTSHTDEMVAISDQVKLQLITFSGPAANKNPPVVFVAGWVSLISGWQTVLIEMTRTHKVYYIETREKISSQVSGRVTYDVDAIGGDVEHLIEHLGLGEQGYILFGSSLGATAILNSYSRLKCKPAGMVLVAPNAVFRVPLTWKIIVKVFYPPLYALIKPSVKWYLRTFRLNLNTDRAQYDKYSRALDAGDPWKLKKAVLALAKYQVWPVLGKIDCPTLIVGASKDKLHEPENMRRIVEMLPDASYVDLETNKQTHSVAMVEAMEQFLSKLSK